jgi:hypothetical protein
MSAIRTASLASPLITSNPPLHADIVEGWHRTAKGTTRWCLPCDEVLVRSLLLLAKWSAMARLTGSAMAPRTILGQAKAQQLSLVVRPHMLIPRLRLRPNSHEMSLPRTRPATSRPSSRSIMGLQGTRVNSREFSISAYLPEASCTVSLNVP